MKATITIDTPELNRTTVIKLVQSIEILIEDIASMHPRLGGIIIEATDADNGGHIHGPRELLSDGFRPR